MSGTCGCRSVSDVSRYEQYSRTSPSRTTPDALAGSYQARSCISGHSCENAYYSYSNSTAASRVQQLAGLLQEFRQFSPAELELAWMMSQLHGNHDRYCRDPFHPAQLASAVLSGIQYQQLHAANQNFFPRQQESPPLTGTRLDATV